MISYFAALIPLATAFPFLTSVLHTRDDSGTYDGHDDLNIARAGTFHCYRGGGWMKQAIVTDTIDQ